MHKPQRQDVTLSAVVAGQPTQIVAHINPAKVSPGTHLFGLFARTLLRDLEEGRSVFGSSPATVKSESIRISCKYSVLCTYTSFVGVESRADATGESMKFKAVKFDSVPTQPTRGVPSYFSASPSGYPYIQPQCAGYQPCSYAPPSPPSPQPGYAPPPKPTCYYMPQQQRAQPPPPMAPPPPPSCCYAAPPPPPSLVATRHHRRHPVVATVHHS
eukprot:TRINITY_DN2306_c0_g1_i1.p2 TRINITY_DN2306_c0_g1~~TRINITY_DN2306_c0_g1_i1.p2  ORF type:complete len:214 (-),score=44.56 TRINITY_DN2306_c0_g1_i1:704-1345(-)